MMALNRYHGLVSLSQPCIAITALHRYHSLVSLLQPCFVIMTFGVCAVDPLVMQRNTLGRFANDIPEQALLVRKSAAHLNAPPP